jgi:hypothetical protein
MKLMLFLGAGVSVPSGLPVAADLTEKVFASRPDEDDASRRLREILTVIRDYDTADIAKVGMSPQWNYQSSGAIYRGPKSTYEDLFFLCQQIALWNIGLSDNSLATSFMKSIQEKAGGLLLGTTPDERICELASLGRQMGAYIERIVTGTLRKAYVKGFELIRELIEAPEIEQLNIVTLNHDRLVEQFLTANEIPFADGFGARDGDVRWSDDRVYADAGIRVQLFKLHGSIDWYSFCHEGRLRAAIFDGADVAKAADGTGSRLKAQTGVPLYLTGINKSDAYQRGVYADIHFHFYALLREIDRILMSGYGWGDTAINFRLDSWFDRSRANKLILLQENPQKLTDKSLVFATGYDAWTRTGQLTCIDRWLCHVSLPELRDQGILFGRVS